MGLIPMSVSAQIIPIVLQAFVLITSAFQTVLPHQPMANTTTIVSVPKTKSANQTTAQATLANLTALNKVLGLTQMAASAQPTLIVYLGLVKVTDASHLASLPRAMELMMLDASAQVMMNVLLTTVHLMLAHQLAVKFLDQDLMIMVALAHLMITATQISVAPISVDPNATHLKVRDSLIIVASVLQIKNVSPTDAY